MLVCFTRGWHLKNFQNASMLITSAGCNYFVGIPHINVLIYHWNMHPDKSYSSMWPSSTLRKEKEKGGMACTSFQSEIGFLHVKPLAYLDLLIGMVNWSFALKLCFYLTQASCDSPQHYSFPVFILEVHPSVRAHCALDTMLCIRHDRTLCPFLHSAHIDLKTAAMTTTHSKHLHG